MDKTIKNIYKDIMNQKSLETNIPQFINHMANGYHTMAAVRLSMHYFSFYEAYVDEGKHWGQEGKELLSQINQIVKSLMLKPIGGSTLEDGIRMVDKIRMTVMNRMNQLTAYTDLFQIYEYVLNRIEYRFKDATDLEENEEFAREILRYIFDTEDHVVINDKIREMIGQLPVRITKQRYFELIRGSMNEYLGAPLDTLETYTYMLRMSAMVDLDDDMDKIYPELWECREFLDKLNYKEITEVDYRKAISYINHTSIFLQNETTVYYGLQEIVNEVYAVLINSTYIDMEMNPLGKKANVALSIIEDINVLYEDELNPYVPESVIDKFTHLEGVQEELSYDLTALEEVLYQINLNHRPLVQSLMVEKPLNAIILSKDLLSNSLFIDFYEIKSTASVTEEQVQEKTEKLVDDLTKLFAQKERIIIRAIMANTMNKMPVFFKNHNEVMEYVQYSLEKCTDVAEKIACNEIIKDLMSE